MIELEFIGGARTVTGSKHLLRTSRATVLLECGLFQGHRSEAAARNRTSPIDVHGLTAAVLSHAHIDHSGALPRLYRSGYRGPIYATPATRDLCVPMLEDAAEIQISDARHIARLIDRGVDLKPVDPLYGRDDVAGTLSQIIAVPYHQTQEIAEGVSLTFLDAGHVLGSAVVVLDVEDRGEKARIAFTGDLGRHHLPILRDPEVPAGVHCLITESTYGNRLHPSIEQMGGELAEVVSRTFQRGGKILIPSFALERAQEVVFELRKLKLAGRLPPLPVYVDSPLAVHLTDVFKLHPECYDEETFKLFRNGHSPFEFDGLKYVSDVEESKAIDAEATPSIIISASGMCEGGRVLHHLRSTVEDPHNTILIVGFQAEHTLGRRLVEGRAEVRIFGVMHPRHAEVVVLDGFSAHADQADLIQYAEDVRDAGSLRSVVLVHGEPSAQQALKLKLEGRGFSGIAIPAPGDRLRIPAPGERLRVAGT